MAEGFAPLETVERYHAEAKASRAAFDDRLRRVEEDRTRAGEQLVFIDEKLRTIQMTVEKLTPSWLGVVRTFGAVGLVLAAWIWQASRYPTRDEVITLSAQALRNQLDVVTLTAEVHSLERQLKVSP